MTIETATYPRMRVPVDDISRQASQVKTGHALLSVVAGFFYLVGYLAGRVVPMLMWCSYAVREGFRSAHGPSKKAQIAALNAQIEDLRMQVSRFSG